MDGEEEGLGRRAPESSIRIRDSTVKKYQKTTKQRWPDWGLGKENREGQKGGGEEEEEVKRQFFFSGGRGGGRVERGRSRRTKTRFGSAIRLGKET